MKKRKQQSQKKKLRRWYQRSFISGLSLQQETVGKDAHQKDLRSCDRYEGGISTKEREGVPVVERRKRRSVGIHTRIIEERVYPTFKIALDSTSVLCRKEEW